MGADADAAARTDQAAAGQSSRGRGLGRRLAKRNRALRALARALAAMKAYSPMAMPQITVALALTPAPRHT